MHTPLYRLSLCTVVVSAMLFTVPASPAQEAVTTTAPVSVVPHLIKFSGALPGASNKAETVDVKFALYAAPSGGEALWSETQQVSLDSAGKYSVLLGSVSTLPNAVFANGQARWIGVTLGSEQESARTILVATPYSLKASDAETLGGHPVSDFTLKNAAQPAGGTNITQINVGNGVTGGGTGPTVTLGLSSSYLETLGNGIYPQIGGTNTMTGTNKFTAGKLLLGTSPVLSASAITGSSPVTATISGNTVKIGLSDSALLTLGNGVYPQLSAANTFTGTETINTADFDAIYAVNSYSGGAGIYAETVGGGSAGTAGFGDVGAFGVATGGIELNAGVLGVFSSYSNEFGTLLTAFDDVVGSGVWGDGGPSSVVGNAVTATTDDGNGVAAYVGNSYAVFYGQSDFTGGFGYLLDVYSSSTGDSCVIDNSANLSCSGTLVTSNVTSDKRQIETYAVQSSENWIEDFGSGDLENGHAVITLDSTFAKVVNTGVGYHVFLTPNGDSKGLYVTNRGTNSFEVRESGGGTSSMSFDYRIVAKRNGKESLRLFDATERNKSMNPSAMRDLQAKGKIHPSAKRLPAHSVVGGGLARVNPLPLK